MILQLCVSEDGEAAGQSPVNILKRYWTLPPDESKFMPEIRQKRMLEREHQISELSMGEDCEGRGGRVVVS